MDKTRDSDSFATIAELCHISSSQEELLNRCPFAGEPEDQSLSDSENDDDVPVESTGIIMLSPPESPQNDEDIPRGDNDVFLTPPEEDSTHHNHQRHEDPTVERVDEEGDLRTFDLGRDTDLGFSESAEKIEISNSGMNSSPLVNEIDNFMVLERESLDSSNKNLGLAVKTLERAVKSIEKLKCSSSKRSKLLDQNLSTEGLHDEVENLSPSNCLNSWRNHQTEEIDGGGYREFHGDSSRKRKLEFCAGGIEGGIEGETEEIEVDDSESCLDGNSAEKQKIREVKSIDDINKFRYVRPTGANSLEKKNDVRTKRTLPMSICGCSGNAEAEMVPVDVPSPKNCQEVTITLLDVLRMLSEEYTYDPALDNLSILEVAKRRGITFP